MITLSSPNINIMGEIYEDVMSNSVLIFSIKHEEIRGEEEPVQGGRAWWSF